MSNYTREIKDTVWLIALQGVNYVMPLLVWPYLMRTLGAEKFGYIGFSFAVVQYFMLIVDFGFNLTATKKIALAKGDRETLSYIFSSTLYARLGLFGTTALGLLVVMMIPQFAMYRSVLSIMFLMVLANTFSFTWLFQGLGKIRVASIVNTAVKVLILPLTFFLVKTPADYLLAASIQSSVYLFSAITLLLLVWRYRWVHFVSVTFKAVWESLKDSFPVFLSSAATSVYTAGFAIVLAYFATPAEVGQYTAVDKLMRALCYLFFVPLSQAFFPKVSSMAKHDPVRAKRLTKRLTVVAAIGMLLILLGMYFGASIIVYFLGNDYANAEHLFKIMAFIPLFVAVGGVLGQLGLLAIGTKQDKKHYQQSYLGVGIFAFVSMFILIPFWGAWGASVALLLTEFLVCVLMFYFFTRLLARKN